MTINGCPYKVECDRILCEVEPFEDCKMYRAFLNQQLEVALQVAEDCGYTKDDTEWLAEFFRVPINRLEGLLK